MNDDLERRLERWYPGDVPRDDDRRRAVARIVDAAARSSDASAAERAGVVSLYPRDEAEERARSATRRAARRMTYMGAAAAAVIVAALAWGVRDAGDRTMAGDTTTLEGAPGSAGPRLVAFSLRVPDQGVRRVTLAGDFNGWNSAETPMTRDAAAGVWRTQVLLSPGRHVYSFVLDGTRWVIDPLAPHAGEDELGPANAIVIPGESE
jgi:hypothetical protein